MTAAPENLLILLASLAGSLALILLLAHLQRGAEDTLGIACLRLLCCTYLKLFHRLRITSPTADPLPPAGPVIVVANHRSGIDPLVIGAATGRRVRFLMAREYYRIRGLRWLFRYLDCIPVNRDGNDLGATKAALTALRHGEVIAVFPQGGIREAEDALAEAKEGTALFALKTGAPVIPMYIQGTPNLDSVLRSFLTPSRSSLVCGAPLDLGRAVAARPSREELHQATGVILGAIAGLQPRGLPAAGAAADERSQSPGTLGSRIDGPVQPG